MLSNETQDKPRPLPPAKARRSSSSNISRSRLSSEMETNASSDASTAPDMNLPNEDSRKELSELFLKADGLIKERENELGMTSAMYKALHQNNLSLKSKHEAFLARIPGSPMHTPLASPSISNNNVNTFNTLSPAVSAGSVAFPASPDPVSGSLSPVPKIRHTRRISVTTKDIALLSDENASLVMRLERLEADSAQAEAASRRQLRRVERELEGLRTELAHTQARGEELEERARAGIDGAVVEAWKRREEHAERVRALRRGSLAEEDERDEEEDEVRNFAPSHPMSCASTSDCGPSPTKPRSLRRVHSAALPTSPAPRVNLATKPSLGNLSQSPSSSSFRSPTPGSDYSTRPEGESALMVQLLSKIQELEDANAQVTETAAQLRAAQADAQNIERVYESLGLGPSLDPNGEGVELEIVVDDDQRTPEDEDPPTEILNSNAPRPLKKRRSTIRLRSLRRTLDGGVQQLLADGGPELIRSLKGHGSKPRKALAGLFDSPIREAPSPVPPSPAPLRPPFESANLTSPTLSSLSINAPFSPTLLDVPPTHGRTLGSELGNDEWGGNAGSFHLRGTSLYDSASMREMPTPVTPTPGLYDFPESESIVPLPYRPGGAANADQNEGDADRKEKQSARYRRMSQTVRSRTSQWVAGRFKDTLLGAKPDEQQPKTPLRAPSRLASAFDVVMEAFGGPPPQEDPSKLDENDETVQEQRLELRAPAEERALTPTKVVLELWLWLQFAVIILVFLYAMARRGPKSVLNDAEARRRVPR